MTPFRPDLPTEQQVADFLSLLDERRLSVLENPERETAFFSSLGELLFDDERRLRTGVSVAPSGLLAPALESAAVDHAAVAERVRLHSQRVAAHSVMQWLEKESCFHRIKTAFSRSRSKPTTPALARAPLAEHRLYRCLVEILLCSFRYNEPLLETSYYPSREDLARAVGLLEELEGLNLWAATLWRSKLPAVEQISHLLRQATRELREASRTYRSPRADRTQPARHFAQYAATVLLRSFGYASPTIVELLCSWRKILPEGGVDEQTIVNWIAEGKRIFAAHTAAARPQPPKNSPL